MKLSSRAVPQRVMDKGRRGGRVYGGGENGGMGRGVESRERRLGEELQTCPDARRDIYQAPTVLGGVTRCFLLSKNFKSPFLAHSLIQR